MTTEASAQSRSTDLLETIADAVISVDATGTIDTWNDAATRLLGFTADQAIGQTLALIVPPASRPAHIHGFHRAMSSGSLDSHGAPVLVTALTAGGSTREIEMTLAVRPGLDGTPSGAVAVMRPAGPREPLIAYAPIEG
jgi:PAS domain S-box-containing protein